MPVFSFMNLEKDCARIFEGAGLAAEEAHRVSHSLVTANLMGHDSHGVIRVEQYINSLQKGLVRPGQQIRVVREADASAVVNGNKGFGQTVCHQAMVLAMQKARLRSIAAVELYNSYHIGRLGEYVEIAAGKNMIGIVMCNNHGGARLMSPFGGIDGRMSPNPLAVGIPTGGEIPIVVDMTSSVVAEGKIRVKKNRTEMLPEGWAIDSEGQPVKHPDDFYGPPRGAILPLGGFAAHKGSALAVVVDILSGALGGGGCSRQDVPTTGHNSVFLMAIQIEAFTSIQDFLNETVTLINFLKSSRTLPGFDEIKIPGELEFGLKRKREKEGVFVDDQTWQQICETGQKLGVNLGE